MNQGCQPAPPGKFSFFHSADRPANSLSHAAGGGGGGRRRRERRKGRRKEGKKEGQKKGGKERSVEDRRVRKRGRRNEGTKEENREVMKDGRKEGRGKDRISSAASIACLHPDDQTARPSCTMRSAVPCPAPRERASSGKRTSDLLPPSRPANRRASRAPLRTRPGVGGGVRARTKPQTRQ